jgi:transketolase
VFVAQILKDGFAVMTVEVQGKTKNKKWSDRMRRAFAQAGKTWDDAVELQVKAAVANAVAANPAQAVRKTTSSVLDNLVGNLEKRLGTCASEEEDTT